MSPQKLQKAFLMSPRGAKNGQNMGGTATTISRVAAPPIFWQFLVPRGLIKNAFGSFGVLYKKMNTKTIGTATG